MNHSRTILLLCLLWSLIASPSLLQAQTALTNADVLKLSEAGLSDDVIIAKIRQSSETAFSLEVDDLLALRQAGLSEAVITAMLERVSPSSDDSPPAAQPPSTLRAPDFRDDLGFDVIKVELESTDGRTPLRLLRGEMSSSGFAYFRFTFMDYPGLHADVRISDRRPTLLVRSRTPLSGGRYFLAKLDADTDDGVRSLKISSFRQRLRASSRSFLEPDPDWTVDYSVEEEGPELWRVTPARDLEPGEYGWYVDFGASAQASGIYDFGVD